MTWQDSAAQLARDGWANIRTILAGVGFTGGGVGLIKLAKHWPAPLKKSLRWGAIFDTIQDVMSNNERIGERRDLDSAFVTKTDAVGKSASAQAITEPVPQGQKEA